jgi:hypothetical protein
MLWVYLSFVSVAVHCGHPLCDLVQSRDMSKVKKIGQHLTFSGWKCIEGTHDEIEEEACDTWSNLECSMGRVVGIALAELNLTGTIPTSLGSLTKLKFLDLGGNKFEGEIPTSLGDLGRLTSLVLSNNRLFGSIPPELSKLKSLKSLYLSNNLLTGTLPASLSSIRKMQWLAISQNRLTGTIPQSYSVFLDSTMELHENLLTGVIPLQLCNALNMYTFKNKDLDNHCPGHCATSGDCDPDGIHHKKYHGTRNNSYSLTGHTSTNNFLFLV